MVTLEFLLVSTSDGVKISIGAETSTVDQWHTFSNMTGLILGDQGFVGV